MIQIILQTSHLLALYYQHPIALQRQKTVFVAEGVHIAFLVGVLVGHVLKIETAIHQFLFGAFAHFFARGNYFFQQPPVLSQNGIDLFDNSTVIGLQLIVILGAAVVIAKLFVDAAFQWFTTAKALFLCVFHGRKIEKSIRFYTGIHG
jgi:hypothetical protein